jgi:hypothetical protein
MTYEAERDAAKAEQAEKNLSDATLQELAEHWDMGKAAGVREGIVRAEARILECAAGFEHNYPEEAKSIRIAAAQLRTLLPSEEKK